MRIFKEALKEVCMCIHLVYRVENFREGDQFVAICPEHNISVSGG
jgi:hypothetical protein